MNKYIVAIAIALLGIATVLGAIETRNLQDLVKDNGHAQNAINLENKAFNEAVVEFAKNQAEFNLETQAFKNDIALVLESQIEFNREMWIENQ